MQQDFLNSVDDRPGPKIAIPRLDRLPPVHKAVEHSKEDRIGRACKSCRKRKVRCSGDVPRCTNCLANDLTCTYDQSRRDRLKEATQLNGTFVALLRDLSLNASEEDKKRIELALENAEDDLSTALPVPSPAPSTGKRSRNQTSPQERDGSGFGEACVSASVGSNEDLDFIEEDLMRSRQSRETGYVGQNSEVQWLRTVQRQAERTLPEPYGLPYGPPGSSRNAFDERADALHERRRNTKTSSMPHVTDSTFYLDSDNIEVDFAVDPYELPDPDTAERFLDCYMSTVHTSFPILPPSFDDQLRRFIRSSKQNMTFEIPTKWRALMNLVFAIGAKYSHLTNAEWRGDERDHLIYMTRAVHLLGLKNLVMFISGPDLLLVQTTGALSLYFLVIGHVSRAWIMIGLSIRLALALGLHLRNEDLSQSHTEKETLSRTWWSLHSIECILSSTTGRPPVITLEDCTAPIPQTSRGDQPRHSTTSGRGSRKRTNHGSERVSSTTSNAQSNKRTATEGQYFVDHVNIALITQKVLVDEYSPRTAVQSWEYLQNKISELLVELETWSKATFSEDNSTENLARQKEYEREQYLLKMYYWSTKILITRPCLCRIERRIRHESHNSANFNTKTGDACVDAALRMTELFPDEPNPYFIYSRSPWWTIVHHTIQGLSVLLLEVALRGSQAKQNLDEILASAKKLIRWLRALRHNDAVAARAYQVVWRILKNCAPDLQIRANDLLAVVEDDGDDDEEDEYQNKDQEDNDNDLDHPTPSQSRFPDSFAQRPPMDQWSRRNGPTPDTINSTMFDNSFPQHQPPMDAFPENENPYFIPEDVFTPMPFGNPFMTSFDQGAPNIDMQDLWLNIAGPWRDIRLDTSETNVVYDDSGGVSPEPTKTNDADLYDQFLPPQE